MNEEFGSIEREIQVAAAAEVVFDVISTPEYIREWWPDEADFETAPGGTGSITFRAVNGVLPDVVEGFEVLEVDRPHRFVFRWGMRPGSPAEAGNSFRVQFDLIANDGGTLVRMTETGFRERGWEAAVLEAAYNDHIAGWDHFIPRLAAYLAHVGSQP